MSGSPARVTPQSFNDLALPVQWIDDRKNPGVLDADELWVHPTLIAANAALAQKGEDPIDPQAIARAALESLRAPNRAIAHPLLAQDVASRTRMTVDFNFEAVPDGSAKEAMRELVKAAAFADLYYNIQRDPDYLRHLRSVMDSGDMERAQHFAQNGGAKCVSVKESACTSLPGETLDPNGVWWPDGFTNDDIKALKADPFWTDARAALKRKVFTPQSRIIEAKEGDADAFPFRGAWYRPVPLTSFADIELVAKKMAEHLGRAAVTLEAEHPHFARMLRSRAQLIAGDSLYGSFEAERLWVEARHPSLLASFGNVESYERLGSPDGMKSLMQGVVAYLDPTMQGFVDGMLARIGDGDKRFWKIWEDDGEVLPVARVASTPPQAGVASIVMNSGAMNAAGYIPGGFNQPNYDNLETDVPPDEQKGRLVYFAPIMAARVQNQGLPLARLAFDPGTARSLAAVIPDLRSGVAFIQAHEIAHRRPAHGRDQELKEKLGEHLAASVEEAKADLVGLFDLETYAKTRLITHRQKRAAQLVHLGNTLRNLYLGKEDEHGRGAIIEFHLLRKHGVITYDTRRKRYRYDPERLSQEIPAIVKEFVGIVLSFDKGMIEAMDREAQMALDASPMRQHIEELGRQGLPGDNLPYYRVRGDLGSF